MDLTGDVVLCGHHMYRGDLSSDIFSSECVLVTCVMVGLSS